MKKLLSLILVTVLLCGLFGAGGVAAAAPVFPDIANHAAEKEIVKLYTLGVIGGYPDGTFAPNGGITRAEFAKILILALGKGGSANLLKNTASQFKDVPAGQWYTGYVNVAVATGVIRGYADGTFRPDTGISQSEAVTMLLRGMGYNDNLPGNWPLNYIMKAADLAIIDETFTAAGLATRGFVCKSTFAMLGWSKVSYTSTTNSFSDPLANGALLSVLSSAAVVGDAVVTAYSATDGTLTIQGLTAPIKVASAVRVVTGEALADLVNRHISYIKRTVSGVQEVIYIEVRTPVIAGKVLAIDAVNNQLVLTSGTVVKLATGCSITKNGAVATIIEVKDSDITALLNTDGKAYMVIAYKLEIKGILTGKQTIVANGVTTRTISVSGFGSPFTVPTTATIVRNGVISSFADLKTGDDIMMSVTTGNVAVYIDAFALAKEAVISSVAINAAGTKVLGISFTDGTTLAVASDITLAPSAVRVGYKTKFALNRYGQITGWLSDTNAVNMVTGAIASAGLTVTSTGTAAFITLNTGVTYWLTTTPDIHRNLADADLAALKPGDAVAISLNSSGKVTAVAAYANGLLAPAAYGLLVSGNLATGAVVTLNAVTADIATVKTTATDVYVTWDALTGKLIRVDGYKWSQVAQTVIGTTITSDGSNTVYVLNCPSVNIALATGFTVRRDGVATTFENIRIGDKINVSPDFKFVEAWTDSKFTWGDATEISLTAGSPMVLNFGDVVRTVKVTVDGTEVTAAIAPDGRSATFARPGVGTHVIGIYATDYAGYSAALSQAVTVGP